MNGSRAVYFCVQKIWWGSCSKSLEIKNLRSLKDTGVVKLSPITILLGENSSGKSTFLRAFPLLKQSAETTTRSSILWFGKYVDYGDFDQALIREKGAKEIVFSFGLTVPDRIYNLPIRLHRPHKDKAESNVTVDLRLASLGKDGLTRTAGLDIDIDGNKIKVDVGESNKISSIFVNGTDYSQYSDTYTYNSAIRLLPLIQAKRENSKEEVYRPWWHHFMPDKVKENLINHLRKFVHGKTGVETIENALYRAPVGDEGLMLAGFKRLFNTATWKNKTANITAEHLGFVVYRDLMLLAKLGISIYNIDEILDNTFRRISYVEPIRASAQRYYRSQDIGVKELDSKGENLAMFLRNLSEREKNSLDEWSMKEFGFKIVVAFNGGHVNLGVAFGLSKESYNLADMGFGFS